MLVRRLLLSVFLCVFLSLSFLDLFSSALVSSFVCRYAVPYDDEKGREISQKLYRRFRVSTLPHVVLLNERAEVINPQAYASMLMNPLDFPWKKKTIKELLGDSLILHHEGGERTVSTVSQKTREEAKLKGVCM